METVYDIANLASLLLIPVFAYIISIERRISKMEGRLSGFFSGHILRKDTEPCG